MENNEVTTSERNEKLKHFLIGLAISTGVTVVLTGGLIGLLVLMGLKFPQDGLLIWIDALTVAGVIMISAYFLVLIADAGTFDMISYAVKLFWYNTFNKEVRKTKLAPTFADYREEKRGKKRTNTVSFLLIPGIIVLVIGLLLLIPFYQNIK